MSASRIELRPCPCCGGEARYQEYTVEDGYTGYRAGDVICTQCGMRTISAPIDGTYGVEWTIEDFAERWNRRMGDEWMNLPDDSGCSKGETER